MIKLSIFHEAQNVAWIMHVQYLLLVKIAIQCFCFEILNLFRLISVSNITDDTDVRLQISLRVLIELEVKDSQMIIKKRKNPPHWR